MDGSNLLAALPDAPARIMAVIADTAPAILAQAVQAGDAVAPEAAGFNFAKAITIVVAMAVLILPFIVGPWLAKSIKMPGYGTRFGFILLAVSASAIILANRLPGLGVDLRGGTILVYEMDPSKIGSGDGQADISSEDLIKPLTDRINPSGTREIVIRPYGENQIEVIVPEVNEMEVNLIKKQFQEAGVLRFAIMANNADHTVQINQAIAQAESSNQGEKLSDTLRDPADRVIALWAAVDRESANADPDRPLRVDVRGGTLRNPATGDLLNLPPSAYGNDPKVSIPRYLDSQGIPGLEVLMIVDPELDVTGSDLDFATSTVDENGGPAVSFRLDDNGAGKFYVLTQNNSPTGSTTRRLGIILDDKLLSAPSIQSAIRKEGRITGNFTRAEVEGLVQILRAGQLPAALTPEPIAENVIDATLGSDTIKKGVAAISVSLGLVLLFIMFYYRFAGLVACFALVMNLAMILATMVLINQPLTLPGLAGLVLTVGMSVDANVLIFERIREELKKGAAPRMAVRNGFGKATVTIIDANLTTLITAIVLYAIGTDQIRGFAVTLILGILFSMFTAIYVSRTFFDLAERRGFLSLAMSDGINSVKTAIAGADGMDFVAKGKFSLFVSAILVSVGVVSIYARGSGIFDIDFAGGSSVQFGLESPATTDQVRKLVEPVMVSDEGPLPYTVNGVSMNGVPENTIYKVDSSFERVEDLQDAIKKAFADSELKLKTNQVRVIDANAQSSYRRSNSVQPAGSDRLGGAVRLVAAQADDAEGDTAIDATADAETESGEPAVAPSTAVARRLRFGGDGDDATATINAGTLRESIVQAADAVGVALPIRAITVKPVADNIDNWTSESSLKYTQWDVELPVDEAVADKVLGEMASTMNSDPTWISSSSIGKRVAGDMIGRAFGALFASLLCIIGYIWFRFQRVIYGLAAVVALIHDVLITLGAIAVSYWLADALGFLMIDPFKISLTVVAAILTIIGYSLNDTIVVFDRIRETKGKAPRLTGEMINSSINQTLSRTLLTSITTLIVVVLLYFFGGAGIHAFAFALVIGVIVGTYSSIFVASPVLHWLVSRDQVATKAV